VRQNPELSRRCSPKIQLQPFSIGSAEERENFQRLLKAFDDFLPTSDPSALVDPSLTEPLYHACHGLIGQLSQLLEMALKGTLYSQSPTLRKEALRWAFERTIYQGCEPHRNPFDPKFDGRPLTEPGEPFNELHA
jgi:hypothetical protein